MPRVSVSQRALLVLIAVSVYSLLFNSRASLKWQANMDPTAQHDKSLVGGMDMDMSMPMYFQLSYRTILWFKEWHTRSAGTYAAALIGLAIFGILHEALASFRVVYNRSKTSVGYTTLAASPEPGAQRPSTDFTHKAVTSALYALNLASGYLLMLAVMTYNIGCFLAVVIGMGIGHFLFNQRLDNAQAPRFDSCCETAVVT